MTWRKRLVRVACAAFIALAAIVGPFVVIGLWPGLNFKAELARRTDRRLGVSIHRTSEIELDALIVECGVAAVVWNRLPEEGRRRGWQTAEGHFGRAVGVKGFGWRGDQEALFLWWPAR